MTNYCYCYAFFRSFFKKELELGSLFFDFTIEYYKIRLHEGILDIDPSENETITFDHSLLVSSLAMTDYTLYRIDKTHSILFV